MRVPAIVFTRTRLALLVAVIMAVTGNRAFFQFVVEVYPWHGNAGFLLSLGILLVAVLILLITLFSLVMPVRAVTGIFLILTAVTGYFSDRLGVVIDAGMIQNVLQTNTEEAGDLLSWWLVLRTLLLGIIPALLVWRVPLKTTVWYRELRFTAQTVVAVVAIMMVSVFPFGNQYASFIREHKMLRYYTNPATPIYSIGKYIANVLNSAAPEGFMMVAANAATPEGSSGRELIIVVVGETARADHFSLNGYLRDTNPRLTGENNLVSFTQITSCGTDTAISVPCLFALNGRTDFDVRSASHTENVLDIMDRAGVNILWRDNNSGSKGVADRVRYEDYRGPGTNHVCDVECRDEGMLAGLQEYIDGQQGDILIVLHQMGSHGPAYYKRYPTDYEKYRPACHTQELSECTQAEIINAYDNTLLYTDYFLSGVIELLKDNTPQFETAMFYISDHGESLGENGLYLHGMPYLFAPETQTHVPIIAWIGPTSDIDYEHTLTLKDVPNSHDAFSISLLEAFEVKAEFYEEPRPVARLFIMKQDNDAV